MKKDVVDESRYQIEADLSLKCEKRLEIENSTMALSLPMKQDSYPNEQPKSNSQHKLGHPKNVGG